jgi:hypothetical protein
MSPPLFPVFQKLRDKLERRFPSGEAAPTNLSTDDQRLLEIVTAILGTTNDRAYQAELSHFINLISSNRRLLTGVLCCKHGITNPSTIDDLSQSCILQFFDTPYRLPGFDPKKVTGSVTGYLRHTLRLTLCDVVRLHFSPPKKKQEPPLAQPRWDKEQQCFSDLIAEGVLKAEDETPTLTGLRAMLAADRQNSVWTLPEFIQHGTSDLLDYHHSDYPACTVREVLYRSQVKEPADTLQQIAKDLGMNNDDAGKDYIGKFEPFYRRYILPRAGALCLEPGLLQGDLVDQTIDEIDHDYQRLMQSKLSAAMPLVTVQFMAQQRLWFYQESKQPQDFEAIAQVARQRFGYRKLTAADVEKFWLVKCQQPLAQVARMVFFG